MLVWEAKVESGAMSMNFALMGSITGVDVVSKTSAEAALAEMRVRKLSEVLWGQVCKTFGAYWSLKFLNV